MNQNENATVLLTEEEINEGMNAHEGLVHALAERLASACGGEADDDLLQAGRMGLWDGLKRYDKSRGTKQTTYVAWWVRRGLLRELERRRKYEDFFPASLQNPVDEEGGATLGDFYAGNLAADPGDDAAREEELEAVRERMKTLSPRERETVELHYGLADGVPLALKEIAARQGVSTTMVHKVLRRALAALRSPAPAA